MRKERAGMDDGVRRGVEPEGPPPLLSSWRNLYLLLLAELGALVLVFYALTRWAS